MMMRVRTAAVGALLGALFLVGSSSLVSAQAGIHYVYDRLGRLTGVVDQAGNTAIYEYDKVGNIVAIRRTDVGSGEPVGISLVSPDRGRAGTTVSIFGKGFSATPSENQVTFGGAPATVTASEPNALTVAVPPEAVSGPVSVTSPSGSATSATPFTIQ
jgi:YD repeat-containing protein